MSVQAMTWAFSLKLGSPSLKVTLLALANRVDDYNTCYPGVTRLANETDLSERTVRTCIGKLEKLGLLRRTRRHTHHGYRTSNSYTLMVGTIPAADLEVDEESEDHPQVLEANIASRQSVAEKSLIKPLEANIASRGALPVDNGAAEAGLAATGARLAANAAPLKEEPKDLTQRLSSSSSEVTTDSTALSSEAAALPPDDDDGEFDGGGGDSAALVDVGLGAWAPSGHSRRATVVEPTPPAVQAAAGGSAVPSGRDGELEGRPSSGDEGESVDLRVLLRAGIEVSLRELDARLKPSEILRRLSDAGVDGERVDIPTAASFALGASVRPVGDPSAYVAAAIIREPTRWPWSALPGAGETGGGPRRSTCELEGHRYLDEFRMQCVRCDEERPGWREERYANEHSPAVAS